MNSRQSGPRRRRRGGRSRGSSSSRPRSGGHYTVTREPRQPAGLWDKIKAFFGLAPQSAKPSAKAAARPEVSGGESRPAREPRPPREARKPEAVEVTTPRLYVGNLSYDAAESDLLELFSGVGTVANVEIITNKHTQRSKGFGFVQMNSVSEAKRAVDELHDKDYMGRKLVVSGAKLPPDRAIGRDREGTSEPAEERAGELAPQA
jgi:hypothetical protein